MEEVRIPFSIDARGVVKGAEEIDKSLERVEKRGKEFDRSSAGQKEQDGYHRRAVDSRKKFHSDIEREIKAHQGRVSAMERSHGKGSAGRYAGDLLNILTGGSGNVMRLNAILHGGAGIGTGVTGLLSGLVAAAGMAASNAAASATRDLQFSTGASVENPLYRGAGGALLRMAPPGMFDQFRVGRGDASSLSGMRGQRSEIEAAIGKQNESEKGIRGWIGSAFGDVLSPLTGGPRSDEKIEAKLKGYEKIDALDHRIAERAKDQSVIDRGRLTDSEHQSNLDEVRLQTAEKLKDIADQGREGKAGIVERIQATKDAKAMEAVQIEAAEREHAASVDELNTRKAIAYFRGGASDTALKIAEEEVGLAERTLANAKNVTEEKRWQLELVLGQKKGAEDSLKLQTAAIRGQEQAAERMGLATLTAGKARLNKDLFSPDEHARFAAKQNISRQTAGAGVANARTAFEQVKREAAEEMAAHSGVLSPETKHRMEMARQAVAAQEDAFAENEMGLKGEVTARRESRFFTAEGRKRPIGQVISEERKRRTVAARFQRARDRLERPAQIGLNSSGLTSGGLVTGSTFDRPDPAAEYARKESPRQASKAAAEEASPKVTNLRLGTIIELLQERLPEA